MCLVAWWSRPQKREIPDPGIRAGTWGIQRDALPSKSRKVHYSGVYLCVAAGIELGHDEPTQRLSNIHYGKLADIS